MQEPSKEQFQRQKAIKRCWESVGNPSHSVAAAAGFELSM